MKRLLPILILLALLIGGGVYLFSKKPQQPAQTTAITPQTGSTQKSLKDLLTMGQAQQCTFQMTADSTGTMYIANGKVRGEFSTTTSGQTIKSHIIVDGKTTYLWMDGQTQGFKMEFDPATQPDASPTAQQGVDANKKFDYICKPWTVDASQFVLPTGITFGDFGALTAPSASTAPGSSTASQCAACDSAPEPAKTQCKKALGC